METAQAACPKALVPSPLETHLGPFRSYLRCTSRKTSISSLEEPTGSHTDTLCLHRVASSGVRRA